MSGSGGPIRRLRQDAATRWRRREPKTAFVFSGGGNLGAIQVGMLRALVDAGITPDLVCGVSVGALNAVAYAHDPRSSGVTRLERLWGRLADGDPDLMPARRLPMAVQAARRGTSMHDPALLEALLVEELGPIHFEDLSVSAAVGAADVDTAEAVWFSSGPVIPALMASAALPAVYPPVRLHGRRLFDGGVLGEAPISAALERGATDIYLLHCGQLVDRELDIRRPFDAAIHAYWTSRLHRFESELAAIPDHVVLHRLPAGSTPRLRFDDFSKGPELTERAYEACTTFLSTGRVADPEVGPTSEPEPTDPSDADLVEELAEDLPARPDEPMEGRAWFRRRGERAPRGSSATGADDDESVEGATTAGGSDDGAPDGTGPPDPEADEPAR